MPVGPLSLQNTNLKMEELKEHVLFMRQTNPYKWRKYSEFVEKPRRKDDLTLLRYFKEHGVTHQNEHKIIIDIMQCNTNAEVIEHACYLLGRIVEVERDDDKRTSLCKRLIALDAHKSIIAEMNDHRGNARVQKEARFACRNLACRNLARRFPKAHESIIAAINEHNSIALSNWVQEIHVKVSLLKRTVLGLLDIRVIFDLIWQGDGHLLIENYIWTVEEEEEKTRVLKDLEKLVISSWAKGK